MKKTLILASALLVLAACKNDKTKVETEKTVIETPSDTMTIDTDTVAAAEVEKATDGVEVVKVEETKEVEVKGAKDIKVNYASFGDKIIADKALTEADMLKKYKGLKAGDTINIKFKSKINDVCQKKGCWMSMQLPGKKESFVKFKDYAFFVPLNAAGQEAIVSGKAFVSEISVSQLKHYAKDGGKSEAEIAKITEPEVKYGFLADGVLISK